MKRLVGLFAIALLACSCANPPLGEFLQPPARPSAWIRDYEFDFSLESDSLLPWFPIWLRTKITNISDHAIPTPEISVNLTPEEPISVFSYDSDSKLVCCCWVAHSGPWRKGFRGRLLAGESQVRYLQLCTQGLQVGQYHIDVKIGWDYFAERPSPPPGPFKRFPISVVAVPSAERQAADLYDSASALRRTLYEPDTRERGYQMLLRVVAEYPGRRYAQLALEDAYQFERLNSGVDVRNRHETAYELLRIFPLSPECIRAARDIILTEGDASLRHVLDSIALTHPEAPVLQVDLYHELRPMDMPPSPRR